LDTFFAITGSACLVLLTDRRVLRLASALAPACKLVVWPTQENRTTHERRVLQSAMAAIGGWRLILKPCFRKIEWISETNADQSSEHAVDSFADQHVCWGKVSGF
jgi:hypothetical protein